MADRLHHRPRHDPRAPRPHLTATAGPRRQPPAHPTATRRENPARNLARRRSRERSHNVPAPNADPETRTQIPTRAVTPSHPAETNTTQSPSQRIGDFRFSLDSGRATNRGLGPAPEYEHDRPSRTPRTPGPPREPQPQPLPHKPRHGHQPLPLDNHSSIWATKDGFGQCCRRTTAIHDTELRAPWSLGPLASCHSKTGNSQLCALMGAQPCSNGLGRVLRFVDQKLGDHGRESWPGKNRRELVR
jgi:hypothetical protein